jgi:hypothetical protein
MGLFTMAPASGARSLPDVLFPPLEGTKALPFFKQCHDRDQWRKAEAQR